MKDSVDKALDELDDLDFSFNESIVKVSLKSKVLINSNAEKKVLRASGPHELRSK